ncbi:MAG: hypothetical protein ACMUHB_01955 [Thermoplasmatota archaeon]
MRYSSLRNIAIFSRIIGWLILVVGLVWGAGDWGAGIYNDDNDQLGGGIQIVGITVGIAVGFLLIASSIDRMADDVRNEELVASLLEASSGRRHKITRR